MDARAIYGPNEQLRTRNRDKNCFDFFRAFSFSSFFLCFTPPKHSSVPLCGRFIQNGGRWRRFLFFWNTLHNEGPLWYDHQSISSRGEAANSFSPRSGPYTATHLKLMKLAARWRLSTYGHIGINGRPRQGVILLVEDHRPGQNWNVLEDLFTHFGQRRHAHEVTCDAKIKSINLTVIDLAWLFLAMGQ